MARLRDDYDEFRLRGAEIVAVAPHGRHTVAAFWRAARLPFPGLADPDHKVALQYRQEVNLFKLGRMPLVIVIDELGMIRYAHRAASMEDIPANQVLLDVIDRIAATRRHSAGS